MRSLIVDDRELITQMVRNIMTKIDPDGDHMATTSPENALQIAKEKVIDVALLDVEMPEMNGVDLAKNLQAIHPRVNIIFLTGYKEYMPDAFGLYASGYLLKPVKEADVRDALAHLRYPPEAASEKRLRVQCFGNFAVFYDGKPVTFSRSKSRELFAYLVDRRGALCTTDMVLGNLWPDEAVSDSMKSMMRTLVADLRNTFRTLGLDDVILKTRDGLAVNTELLECDYYRYLEGDPTALRAFTGEYMSQYEFAEETAAALSGELYDY